MEASVDLAEVDLRREDLAGQDPPAATAAGRQVLGPPLSADLAARAAAPASSLAALTTSAAFRRLHSMPTCPRGTIAPPPRPQSLSSGMFSTWPHALQCTASGSWRCSPHCGQGWRTLPPGRKAACARRKNSVIPTIIMATESSSPEVLPRSVMSPKPVVESAATVKCRNREVERVHEVGDLLVGP